MNRNRPMILALLSAGLLAGLCALSGCTGTPSQAQGQAVSATTPQVLFQDVTCPADSSGAGTGCIRHVSIKPDGSLYYLSLRVGPEPFPEANTFSVVLNAQMDITRVECWLGTSFDSELEVQSLFQYRKPDGTGAEFILEYDKHQDVVGNRQMIRQFQTPIHLPAGTVVTITHNRGFSRSPLGCPGCLTDMVWNMYSE